MKTPNNPQNTANRNSQHSWLGVFFAGMYGHILQLFSLAGHATPRVINIIYGTQTGNSETIANDTAIAAKALGLCPIVNCMDEIELDALAIMDYVLIVTSTYGDGEMPDNAQLLWEQIAADSAPKMENMKFSILALGDSSYDQYCQAGKDWDKRLAALKATRIYDRVDCDVGLNQVTEKWISRIIPMMAEGATVTAAAEETVVTDKPRYNLQNPFSTTININRLLTAENSSKEIRHYEFSLEGSSLTYEAGDALNVIPQNCPKLVADIIHAIGCAGHENDPVDGKLTPLYEALHTKFEIKLPSKELLHELAARSGDQELNDLLESEEKDKLANYLWGRDTLDLLLQFPDINFSAAKFIALLKPLNHRAYSISSSEKLYPNSIHLTVASVRYNSHNRDHKGVCSTYMADLVDENTEVKIFLSPNHNFKVPEDDSLPMIMVGPGIGIAPFRAFLQEREFRKASGKNWLIFGDRNANTDYIYQDEIEAMHDNGLITRLDLAFSRDQEEKIYVQDRMRENGAEMFAWLEQGGSFFVCGDANYMAKDVDKVLHEIIEEHGNNTAEQAIDYMNHLKKEKRYVRDVY